MPILMKILQTKLQQKGLYNGAIDGLIGPKSIAATSSLIFSEIKKRGWKYPKTDIVYLRLDKILTDTFDDVACLFIAGVLTKIFPCSTTAGSYYVNNPITYGGIKGTAIAQEQQVINSHKYITSANWKSLWLGGPYFQQIAPINIYRDGKIDNKIDSDILQNGLFGINFHRGGVGNIIYNWSAGCFVTPDIHWWEVVKNFTNGQVINMTLLEIL